MKVSKREICRNWEIQEQEVLWVAEKIWQHFDGLGKVYPDAETEEGPSCAKIGLAKSSEQDEIPEQGQVEECRDISKPYCLRLALLYNGTCQEEADVGVVCSASPTETLAYKGGWFTECRFDCGVLGVLEFD